MKKKDAETRHRHSHNRLVVFCSYGVEGFGFRGLGLGLAI